MSDWTPYRPNRPRPDADALRQREHDDWLRAVEIATRELPARGFSNCGAIASATIKCRAVAGAPTQAPLTRSDARGGGGPSAGSATGLTTVSPPVKRDSLTAVARTTTGARNVGRALISGARVRPDAAGMAVTRTRLAERD